MCIIQQSFYRFFMCVPASFEYLPVMLIISSTFSATIQITVVMITTTTKTALINSNSILLPSPTQILTTIKMKHCAKCGDIHSTFNGNG